MSVYQTFGKIMDAERLDAWDEAQLQAALKDDYDEVFIRACKVIPTLMSDEFSYWQGDEAYEDMVAAAYVGVKHALDTWDPSKGTQLSSWAYLCAKQHVIKEALRETRWRERNHLTDFDFVNDDYVETEMHPSDARDDLQGHAERDMQWQAEYSLLRKKLPDVQKIVLDGMLYGRSYREIAELAGVSHTQVARLIGEIEAFVAKIQQN